MGLQKSPANQKQETPPKPKPPLPSPSSGKSGSQKAVFSRSFGVYFPRSSAQVQPRPPDVTELLGHKLLKESAAIVPVLESEISRRTAELGLANEKVQRLEVENERLEMELRDVKEKFEEDRREGERKVKKMEMEIAELKKTASDSDYNKVEMNVESDEFSLSQRIQGLMEISMKSNIIRNLKKANRCGEITVSTSQENHRAETLDLRREEVETLINLRSRVARVPKPPPRPFSSSSPSSPTSSDGYCPSIPSPLPPAMKSVVPPPPPPLVKAAPPPPPPPPLKGIKGGHANVRKVPEVVEFYHSLMRRDSRRDTGGGTTELAPATLNARDMIGEIENRSTHLLAVSTGFP